MTYLQNAALQIAKEQPGQSKKEQLSGIDGIEFLRAAINWLDGRDEILNENKTPEYLLKEFADTIV